MFADGQPNISLPTRGFGSIIALINALCARVDLYCCTTQAFELPDCLFFINNFSIFGLKIEQAGLMGSDVAIGTCVANYKRSEAVLKCIECRSTYAP